MAKARTLNRRNYEPKEEHFGTEIHEGQDKIRLAERLNGLFTIAEQIAQDKTIVMKNWVWPGAEKICSGKGDMQWVDLYYPKAIGGPLLVDQPRLSFEVAKCEDKKKILKGLGLRYVYITPNMKLNDALMQMED